MFLYRAHELKEQGNTHFARREHVQALACYAQALRLTPETHPDRALFHSNRAACYLRDKQHQEVIHECNLALKVSPKFAKALLRRARAYEMSGDNQRALSDARVLIQDCSLTGPSLEEAQELETRVKQTVAANSGKKKKSRTPAPAPAAPTPAANSNVPRKMPQLLTLKCSLGEDNRLVQVPTTLHFAELVSAVKRKFPEETGNLLLKYKDRENDLISINNRQDMLAAIVAASKSKSGPAGLGGLGLAPAGPTTIPLTVVRAEKAEGEGEEVVEFDDWLLDFAELFREHLGIDADGHVDLHNEGLEKCNQALEAAVGSDKAGVLFDQAAAKFQEVAALALLNWGNVHMCQARRLFDGLGEAASSPAAETREEAEKHYHAAEEKYKKALELKSDFYEAVIASGQQLFERAKLLSSSGEAKDGEKKEPAATPEELEELFESAQEKLKAALTLIPETPAEEKEEEKVSAEKPKAEVKEEKAKDEKTEGAEGEAGKEATVPDEMLVRSQVLVMWGNVLYEQSQVRFNQKKEWQKLLDEAVEKFREAKCSEEDIAGALASHVAKEGEKKAEDKDKTEPAAAGKEEKGEKKKDAQAGEKKNDAQAGEKKKDAQAGEAKEGGKKKGKKGK
eukprot:gene6063-7286_t